MMHEQAFILRQTYERTAIPNPGAVAGGRQGLLAVDHGERRIYELVTASNTLVTCATMF
jgi:hypothetical protein